MANDSTVCTSIQNVRKTAHRIVLLEAQRDYLLAEIQATDSSNVLMIQELEYLRKQIKKEKRKDLFEALRVLAAFVVGVATGKII